MRAAMVNLPLTTAFRPPSRPRMNSASPDFVARKKGIDLSVRVLPRETEASFHSRFDQRSIGRLATRRVSSSNPSVCQLLMIAVFWRIETSVSLIS